MYDACQFSELHLWTCASACACGLVAAVIYVWLQPARAHELAVTTGGGFMFLRPAMHRPTGTSNT